MARPKSETPSQQITVKLPTDLIEAVNARAEREKITRSEAIRIALTAWAEGRIGNTETRIGNTETPPAGKTNTVFPPSIFRPTTSPRRTEVTPRFKGTK